MKRKHISLATIALGASLFAANAQQNARTAYFFNDYAHIYRLNPALTSDRGHAAIGAGEIGISAQSNLGLSTFIYPTGNKPTTFLNPKVDANEFLGKLGKDNPMLLDLDLDILSASFHTGKLFHNFDVTLRTDNGITVPYDAFRFMKAGSADGRNTFAFSNLSLKHNSYLQIAYGVSVELNEGLRVGGRLKALGGIAGIDMNVANADILASADLWDISAQGQLRAALPKMVTVPLKPGTNEIDFGGIDADESIRNNGLTGMGAALDLGVTWTTFDDLTVSAAVLDLGFMHWNNGLMAQSPALAWKFDGFHDIDLSGKDESQPSLGDQLNNIFDEIEGCMKFEKTGNSAYSTMLAATVNAGAEYRMPFYDKLSAGVLLTANIDRHFGWKEGRVCLNWAPLDGLEFAGSAAYSDFGASLGAAVNARLLCFNLFACVDSLLPMREVNPQFIPIGKLNTNATVGLNIVFGKRKNN